MPNRAGRAAEEICVPVGDVSNRDGSLRARKAGKSGKSMQVLKSGANSK